MYATRAKPPAQGYLKQQAAAAFLGVTVRTLARWEEAGIVRGHRVRPGGAKLYDVEALRKAAAGQSVSSHT